MGRDFADLDAEREAIRAENGMDDPGSSPFVDPNRDAGPEPIHATPFEWRDPATLPRRRWVYGRHLIRGHVSVTVAPGGVGKSSNGIVEAIDMVSGRKLLADWCARDLRVWVWNLEDPREELERRLIAAMLHHEVAPHEIEGRLFVDSGQERGLCLATQTRDGASINRREIDELGQEIARRKIDVLIVDPFVSAHRVNENDNGAVDLVAKELARLADRHNIAIELVHHTRKINGDEPTTEHSRGGSALVFASRSARVLTKMTALQRTEAGIKDDPATYFSVTRDKPNLAPAGTREWRRIASVPLGNGDTVGVVEAWDWPNTFEGMSASDLLAVQRAIEARCGNGQPPRFSDQAGEEWVGLLVANVLELDPDEDRKRIRKMINAWLKSGALVKGKMIDDQRRERPTVEVGEWGTV